MRWHCRALLACRYPGLNVHIGPNNRGIAFGAVLRLQCCNLLCAMSGDEGSASASGDEGNVVSVKEVAQIMVGKIVWYPSTKVAQNQSYFKLDKHDPVLTKLVTGRGQTDTRTVSESGSPRKLRTEQARKAACDQAFHEVQLQAISAAGQDAAACKCRPALDGDAIFVPGGCVNITIAGVMVKTTFALKGPFWIELSAEAVKAVLTALKRSTDHQPGSPKKRAKPKAKRRAKRDIEALAGDDHHAEGDDHAEHQEAEAAPADEAEATEHGSVRSCWAAL